MGNEIQYVSATTYVGEANARALKQRDARTRSVEIQASSLLY